MYFSELTDSSASNQLSAINNQMSTLSISLVLPSLKLMLSSILAASSYSSLLSLISAISRLKRQSFKRKNELNQRIYTYFFIKLNWSFHLFDFLNGMFANCQSIFRRENFKVFGNVINNSLWITTLWSICKILINETDGSIGIFFRDNAFSVFHFKWIYLFI